MNKYLPQRSIIIFFILSVFVAPKILGTNKIYNETELPVLISDNRIIVEVEIQGLDKQYFILDMAASGSVISPYLKNQINLTPDDIKIDTVHGASGHRLMEFVMLPEVKFAGHTFDGIDAVVFDTDIFKEYEDKNVQGILGVDVLQHFDLSLNLNDNNIKIKLLDANKKNINTNLGDIPFESKAMPGFVEFEIDVNGMTMNAFFDTGGKKSILNWKAAKSLGINKQNELLRLKESGTQGIDGGKEETFLYTFEELKIGPALLKNNEVKIADLPVFDLMGYGDFPVILIGIDFMRKCSVDIYYSSNTIQLCKD